MMMRMERAVAAIATHSRARTPMSKQNAAETSASPEASKKRDDGEKDQIDAFTEGMRPISLGNESPSGCLSSLSHCQKWRYGQRCNAMHQYVFIPIGPSPLTIERCGSPVLHEVLRARPVEGNVGVVLKIEGGS
ncbi:hypothetical protein RND71_015525 [Anisodus tanguticus]|uniref:Uncharacterized protein n=1 Tax=Anisodus tanguticus TaxID=243964 RepID=A0AAE1S6N6_9SOLA|nr:hypothetical protein RND71_015525 [Anisodus tanguticus]